jgi:4-aminobutyrate aminotransferase
VTPTPDGDAVDLADLARQHFTPVLGRYFERSWSHGDGHRLYDTAGKAYLDFANGIAVSALGHRHPAVTAAIHEQVDRLMVPTGAIGYSEPPVVLAAELAKTFPEPLDTVMFLNSGSEAIEAALKLARRVTGRPGIIAFRGGFHGRTFGAASVTTSNINYRTGYEPLLPGVYFAPFPTAYPEFAGDGQAASDACLAILHSLLETVIAPASVAAILIEPVQGEGGYYPAPAEFLQALQAICHEHGILLIADEVQTGFGRTGRMFAVEHWDVEPDILVMAKGIASGMPLSGILARTEIMDRWKPGTHGGTYGGNVVSCAAANATIDVIEDEDLVANARARGAQLVGGLRELQADHPAIGDVRGLGCMVAMEFVQRGAGDGRVPDADLTKRVIGEALDRRLIVLSAGSYVNVTRIIPPLVTTSDEVDRALGILDESLVAAGA